MLLKHQPWDHEIPLIKGAKLKYKGGIILLSKKEEDFLKEYIKDLLGKEFIRLSMLSIAYRVLFIPKKDRGLRPYINYRKINTLTKKNRYLLLRINKL